jgi:hypothetical protein
MCKYTDGNSSYVTNYYTTPSQEEELGSTEIY